MSSFIRHLPCKSCGSKDNLGEYTDHFWCFGCGYYKEKDDIKSIRDRVLGQNYKEISIENLVFTKHIPKQAMRWLLQYRITLKEIEDHNILWCQSNETLILVHKKDYWQGRHFGKYGMKYLSKGKKPLTIRRKWYYSISRRCFICY